MEFSLLQREPARSVLPPEQLATGCSGPAGPALGLVTAQTPLHPDAGSRNLAGGSFPSLKILQAEKNQSPECQGRRGGKEEAEDRGQEQMLEKLELALQSKALSDKGMGEVCGMGCRALLSSRCCRSSRQHHFSLLLRGVGACSPALQAEQQAAVLAYSSNLSK